MTVLTEKEYLNLPDFSTRQKIKNYINRNKQSYSIQDNYIMNKHYQLDIYHDVKIYNSQEEHNNSTIEPYISDFVKVIAVEFSKNLKKDYYIGEVNGQTFLALRWGLYNDCIKLYSLGKVIGIFSGYIYDREPLLANTKNIVEEIYIKDNNELRNKLDQAIHMMNGKDNYIEQLQNKIANRDETLYWYKEEEKRKNYNNWIDGKYISNVTIFEGE